MKCLNTKYFQLFIRRIFLFQVPMHYLEELTTTLFDLLILQYTETVSPKPTQNKTSV